MIKRSLGLAVALILHAGCGEQRQPAVNSPQPAPQAVKAPFEYRIVETDDTPHTVGPQIVLTIETTDDVAKKATRDDLIQFWKFMRPNLGNRRVFIYFETPVPGVSPWGMITRLNLTGKWEVRVSKNEYGIDAEPYYFVDKIERSKPNQGAMILTLPVVNRIVERLKRTGWTVKTRKEDIVSADLNPVFGSLNVVLTPEGIDVSATRIDDLVLMDTIELLTEELSIGGDIKRKLQSVIGSPEYVRGVDDGRAVWHWTIGDYDVSYYHIAEGMDQLNIGYAN